MDFCSSVRSVLPQPNRVNSCLIEIDHDSKLVPGLSLIVAIFNLFQKCILFICPSIYLDKSKYLHKYFKYLHNKSLFDCCVSLVPLLGNIYFLKMEFNDQRNIDLSQLFIRIQVFDLYSKIKIKQLIKSLPKHLQDPLIHHILDIWGDTCYCPLDKGKIIKLFKYINNYPCKAKIINFNFLKIVRDVSRKSLPNDFMEIIMDPHNVDKLCNIFSKSPDHNSSIMDFILTFPSGQQTTVIRFIDDYLNKSVEYYEIHRSLKMNLESGTTLTEFVSFAEYSEKLQLRRARSLKLWDCIKLAKEIQEKFQNSFDSFFTTIRIGYLADGLKIIKNLQQLPRDKKMEVLHAVQTYNSKESTILGYILLKNIKDLDLQKL